MARKPVPVLAALCSLALLTLAGAQRPLSALLPESTVLAVEIAPTALDATVLQGLLADLDTREAERVWDLMENLFLAGAEEIRTVPERPSTAPDGHSGREVHEHPDDLDALLEELSATCPALSEAVEDVDVRAWSAAAGVSVSRFDPEPALLLALRPGSRLRSARLLAGAVACFDGRRFGAEGASAIYLFGDASEMPLLLAEQGGDLLLASDPELLRGAIRRAAGSGEPSLADARIASFAEQLELAGLKVTLDLTAAADALGMIRGAIPPEGAALFERLVTTLRIVGGYAWGLTLDDQGVLLQSVAAWDADLAREAGEEELLAMLACEGCALTQPPLLHQGAVATSGGAFPLDAAVAWLDSWLADVSAVALPGDEPRTVRAAVAEFAGVDLDAALLDWFGGSWYSATMGVLDTDLRNWIMGLPTVVVVPVTSEAAARDGVRLWLDAAENLGDLTDEFAGVVASGVGEAVSVRELTHGGVDYLRVRAGPSFDVGVAVFDDNLVIGTPVTSLLEAIDRRGASAEPTGALAPGLAALDGVDGSLVGYSVTDVGSFLSGLARLTELASGTMATTLWLGGMGLAEGETGTSPEDLALPTYDDALVLTDLAVEALELLAERVGPSIRSTTVRDDARWTTWRLPLGETAR